MNCFLKNRQKHKNNNKIRQERKLGRGGAVAVTCSGESREGMNGWIAGGRGALVVWHASGRSVFTRGKPASEKRLPREHDAIRLMFQV